MLDTGLFEYRESKERVEAPAGENDRFLLHRLSLFPARGSGSRSSAGGKHGFTVYAEPK